MSRVVAEACSRAIVFTSIRLNSGKFELKIAHDMKIDKKEESLLIEKFNNHHQAHFELFFMRCRIALDLLQVYRTSFYRRHVAYARCRIKQVDFDKSTYFNKLKEIVNTCYVEFIEAGSPVPKKRRLIAAIPQSFIHHLYRSQPAERLVELFGNGSLDVANDMYREILVNQRLLKESEPISLAEYKRLKKEQKIE